MSIGKRVKKRLEELKMSEYAAAKHLGIHYSNIQGLTSGRVQKPRYLGELAEVLQVKEKWLRTGETPKEFNEAQDPYNHMRINSQTESSYAIEQRSLPVFGTAAAGDEKGAFQISMGAPIDYVLRPPHLAHNQHAFAIYVEGSSMEPKFEAGDLIFVDPHRSPKLYDYIIIELIDSYGEREVFIKRYLGKKNNHLICLQYNPHGERSYSLDKVVKIHRVFNNNDLFGA